MYGVYPWLHHTRSGGPDLEAALVRRNISWPGALKDIRRTYVRGVGGDWRDGFEYAWQALDPEPDEGPGLTWRQLAPQLVGVVEREAPRDHHRRRRRLARLRAARGPARSLAHHHRRPLCDRRGGAARYRQGMGGAVDGAAEATSDVRAENRSLRARPGRSAVPLPAAGHPPPNRDHERHARLSTSATHTRARPGAPATARSWCRTAQPSAVQPADHLQPHQLRDDLVPDLRRHGPQPPGFGGSATTGRGWSATARRSPLSACTRRFGNGPRRPTSPDPNFRNSFAAAWRSPPGYELAASENREGPLPRSLTSAEVLFGDSDPSFVHWSPSLEARHRATPRAAPAIQATPPTMIQLRVDMAVIGRSRCQSLTFGAFTWGGLIR